ncbi:hypothetical protein [Pedobacter sp. BMA]|uniref:hypothetical protein n=1 Tax=Pedobacter sp. BMA TaxID=1663685 RepID=UPI000649CFDA|nr:hypothetical protein [Pedobacter sp. BMA]KLT63939.1 hypothetical protein AB669_19625 [Pedobacter sp. BMA]
MKWKEALYGLNKNGLIAPQDLDALLLIPKLRDEVFFPAYSALGYTAKEPVFETLSRELNVYRINISISSVITRRLLDLAFVFQPGKDINCSIVNDRIYNIDFTSSLGHAVDMHILLSLRTEKSLDIDYRRLNRYIGSTDAKIKMCLEQIRYNYDTIAPDIIDGNVWLTNAQESYEGL